jgi:hypothetical protein
MVSLLLLLLLAFFVSLQKAAVTWRDSTNYHEWTQNKQGWGLLTRTMTPTEAAACKPQGVVFDSDGQVTQIILLDCGLKGGTRVCKV